MFLEEGNSPPSPLVNQEQMGSPTTSVPKLNLKQIEQFKELVTRAYNLARTYNGSSLKRDVFLNAVQSLKDFTEPFCSESKFSEAQLLASFAYQSKTVFSDNFSIQNLYDAAFSNFLPYRASQPTDTRRLIQFLWFKGRY